MLKKTVVVVFGMVGGVLLGAGPASAHTHYLTLPNGEQQYLANGANGHVEGAEWHPLHCLVHTGTPGTKAFDNANNPVDIFKTGTFSGNCASKPGALP